MIQLADEHDLYCSGWVDSKHEPSTLSVAGSELEKIMQASGDVVFLNQGRNQGIAAGAEYLVVRPDHKVIHPATNEVLGTYIQRMGHVRVLCAQENTATAVILGACEGLRNGDELLPWKEMPSPMLERIPPVDRCMEPSGPRAGAGWSTAAPTSSTPSAEATSSRPISATRPASVRVTPDALPRQRRSASLDSRTGGRSHRRR